MRAFTHLTALLAALALAPPLIAAPECDVDVQVAAPDGVAVAEAVVTLIESERSVVTGADGGACLSGVEAGRHGLLVVAGGFTVADATFERLAGEQVRIEVTLTPAFGEEVVVTGTRVAKRLQDVPFHVQQVSSEAIELSAARTLAEAIELTPGVRIESNCQNCNFSQVRLMGLEGPYTQLLVDGQPTVSSLAMVYGIEQFPAQLLETVEVVKGGGAAIYGGGAVGGVINLIPHAPNDTHASFEASYSESGGVGGERLSAIADWSPAGGSGGFSILGETDRVGAVDRDGDGFTEVTRRALDTVALRGELYVLGDVARLVAEGNYTRADRRGGALEGIERAPHETELAEEIGTRRVGLGLSWLHTVGPALDYRLAASWASTDRDSYYGADFDPNAYGRTENPLWVLDGQVNGYRDADTISVGVQHSRDELDDLQPGYGRELRQVSTNTGAYVQHDRKLGARSSVLYGLRADDHSALESPVVSPRLALMTSPRSDLTFRLSAARGFRPPVTFDEDLHIELAGGAARIVTPDADLRSERSTAFLLSGEWRPTFGRKGSASIELAAFRTDLDELFLVVEDDDPTTVDRTEFTRMNAGGATVDGVELVGSLRWGSNLAVQAGIVSQRSRFSEPEPDFGSRRFFRTPDLHGTFSVQWTPLERWRLFAGGRYTGPMVAPHYAGYIEEDRLERTPSFLELDLNVARDFVLAGRDLTLGVGVRNLTDAYQDDLDRGPARDSSYVYGPRFPRSLFARLRLKL